MDLKAPLDLSRLDLYIPLYGTFLSYRKHRLPAPARGRGVSGLLARCACDGLLDHHHQRAGSWAAEMMQRKKMLILQPRRKKESSTG